MEASVLLLVSSLKQYDNRNLILLPHVSSKDPHLSGFSSPSVPGKSLHTCERFTAYSLPGRGLEYTRRIT
jgi:hypothetical protein